MDSPWKRNLGLLLLCLCVFLPGQSRLPPIDRDEARFVQATKQMVQSGDYMDIRFQDKPRYNKPIGVYWLQAACVRSVGAIDEISSYRVPSWLAATAAVLITAGFATRLFGVVAGLLAGAVLASSILLGIEARLAKSDAILLAFTTLAQSILARVYVERTLSRGLAWLFWLALGAGVLVKGPIIVLVILATTVALALSERSLAWLAPLRPIAGLVLLFVVTAPWVIAITIRSGSAFWRDSLGTDFAAKLSSVQESHGGPPGYYLFTVFLTLWPWSPLLLPASWYAWNHRQSSAVRFYAAWIIPAWIGFEVAPTKLPHYPLPLFPALAALIGAAICDAGRPIWMSRIVFWHATVLIGCALLGMLGATFLLDTDLLPSAVVLTAIVGALAVGAWRNRERRPATSAVLVICAVVLFQGTYFSWILPQAEALWLSRSAARLIERHRQGGAMPLVAVGYTEPSLVFLTGTSTLLEPEGVDGIRDAERRMESAPGTLLLIDAEDVDRLLVSVTELGRVTGINYSRGRRQELVLVRLKPANASVREDGCP